MQQYGNTNHFENGQASSPNGSENQAFRMNLQENCLRKEQF